MMLDRRRIVDMWRRGEAVALVTLVRVEGSSYRRVGARLLVGNDGRYAGSISGGCLEAEVVRKAQWMVRAGAVVERYSTLFDDTAEIPYGLGCGGTVDLLLEPAGTAEFASVMEAMEASLHGEARQILTQLPGASQAMRRHVLDAAGRYVSGSPAAPAEGTFDEWFEAPQRLWVFGAGDDAQPMVEMASLLGWNVTVVDGRAQWAREQRFPKADRVLVAAATEGVKGLGVSEGDVVVVMTHSYEQDRAWLAGLLAIRPRYLGLLGARHRSALLVSEVAVRIGCSVEEACEGLFAPVGLDLGGDGAEAIALAVIAEMQACVEGKIGVSRRMNADLVAEQIAKGGASRYLQAQCAL